MAPRPGGGSATRTGVRLSLVGDAGRLDLAVDPAAAGATLAEEYAGRLGLPDAPTLRTLRGDLLAPDRSLAELGLRSGAVLLAETAGHSADHSADHSAVRAAPGAGSRSSEPVPPATLAAHPAALLLSVALAAASAAAATLPSYPGPARWLCVPIFLGCLVGVVVRSGRLDGADAESLAVTAPAFAAAAGWTAGYSPEPGGTQVGVLAAGLMAVVGAAVARAAISLDRDERLRVWLVGGGALGAAAVLLLLGGADAAVLLALAYGVAVAAARLLPYAAVDVPDDVLLDLDRLAVTSWSARERPRGRRRAMVRPESVAELVRRGQGVLLTGTLAIALAAVIAGPAAIWATRGQGASAVGTLVMVAAGGCALALTARSVRARVPRAALRLAAVIDLAVLGGLLLARHAPGSPWPWLAGAWVLGGLALLAALLLGRGWRSVWWARMADVAETLCVVVVLAALPVATGLFTVVRGLPG